jgi:hypothetical protein
MAPKATKIYPTTATKTEINSTATKINSTTTQQPKYNQQQEQPKT